LLKTFFIVPLPAFDRQKTGPESPVFQFAHDPTIS